MTCSRRAQRGKGGNSRRIPCMYICIYTYIPNIRLALDVHAEVKEITQDASPVCIYDIHMHPSHTTCSRRAQRGKGGNSRRIPCMYT